MTFWFRDMAVIAMLVMFAQVSPAAEFTFDQLVGKWRAERLQPEGETVVVELEITSDHIFSGIVFANRVPVWTYAGTCELKGNELTWTYLESTQPLEHEQDTDVIESIDSKQFTYTSMLSGETGSYDRVE